MTSDLVSSCTPTEAQIQDTGRWIDFNVDLIDAGPMLQALNFFFHLHKKHKSMEYGRDTSVERNFKLPSLYR
jgi:hypothetical protein